MVSKDDLAAVELDERLDQAEAQADPALAELVVARGVVERVEAGEERLEQVRLLGGVDADALVGDLEADPVRAPSGPGGDADRAAVGGELDGVGEQVGQDVGELRRVDLGAARGRGRARARRCCARSVEERRSSATTRRIRGSSAVGLEVERLAELVGPDELEHPLDGRGEPLARRAGSDRPSCRSTGGGVGAERDLPELGHAQDDGHRGVQLVAGDLDEGALEAVGLDQPLVRRLQLGQEPGLLDDQVVLLDGLADDGLELVGLPGLGDVAEDAAPG